MALNLSTTLPTIYDRTVLKKEYPAYVNVIDRILNSRNVRSTNQRKNGEDRVPRPRNSYMLYLIWKRATYPIDGKRVEASRIYGNLWHEENSDIKDMFTKMSRVEDMEHKIMYPGYKFITSKKRISKKRLPKEQLSKKRLPKEQLSKETLPEMDSGYQECIQEIHNLLGLLTFAYFKSNTLPKNFTIDIDILSQLNIINNIGNIMDINYNELFEILQAWIDGCIESKSAVGFNFITHLQKVKNMVDELQDIDGLSIDKLVNYNTIIETLLNDCKDYEETEDIDETDIADTGLDIY